MTQNALAIYQDFDGLQRAAMALYKSGYFDDVKSEAQAIVKVMAGAEMGIAPFASMSGIDIIQGKPTPGANLLATIVDNHPRYDFKVLVATDEKCEIEWFKDGVSVGKSAFTMQEAKKIQQWNAKKNAWEPLSEKFNWKNYPSDMLFARAITRGQKRYAPGVAGGAPVYTPDEMGVDTDEEGYIDAESIAITEPQKRTNDEIIKELGFEPDDKSDIKPDFSHRPWDADTLKAALDERATGKNAGYEPSEKQRNLLGALLSEFYQDDDKRHTVQLWLLGAASTKDVDGGMVKTAIDWLAPEKVADGSGSYVINSVSKTELSGVYDAAVKSEGQETLI